MTNENKLRGTLIGIVCLIVALVVFYVTRPVASTSFGAAGPLYRNQFNNVFLATTTSVTATGVIIVNSSSYTPGAATFLSIVDSGSSGVSCYPIDFVNGVESTSSLTYGGGWWLAGNGGAITFDSVGMYGGTVWCVASTTTQIGVVAR